MNTPVRTIQRCRPAKKGCSTRSFTLIELLVVISIIAVLLGVLLPALGRAKGAAAITRQVAAAKQLMQGYIMYAQEHNGYVLPAVVGPHAPKQLQEQPLDAGSEPVPSAAAKRYFWRLAPYLDYNIDIFYRDRSLLTNEDIMNPGLGFSYNVTLYPGFGINRLFVGGKPDYYNPSMINLRNQTHAGSTGWWVAKMTDADQPTRLFTFVSAAYDATGEFIRGYFQVDSPYFSSLTGPKWTDMGLPTRPGASPGKTGNVWPVDGNTSVAGLLDGHASSFDWDEMKDMRHWAPKADKPDWTLDQSLNN